MAREKGIIISPSESKRERSNRDAAELLFEVSNIEHNDLPYIRLWPNEKGISSGERAEREEVVRELERHLRLLSEAAARVQDRSITLVDVQKDTRFKKAQQTLDELLHRTDLFQYLENKKKLLTAKENEADTTNPLLPAADFEPSWFSPEEISIATNVLAINIADIDVPAELESAKQLVADFLHSQELIEYVLQHLEKTKSLQDTFSLLWIKTNEPKVWVALCQLVQSNRKILHAILGNPTEHDDSDTGREKEIKGKLANAINIALLKSAEAVGNNELNGSYRQAEKIALTEFYGTLPQEFDYEAEELLLNVEIQKILDSLGTSLTENEKIFYGDGLKLLKSKNPFGKTDKLARHEKWPEFLKAFEKRFKYALDERLAPRATKEIREMPGVLLNAVGNLMNAADDCAPRIKSLLSEYQGTRGRNAKELHDKITNVENKESHMQETAYKFLCALNRRILDYGILIAEAGKANMGRGDMSFAGRLRDTNARYVRQVRRMFPAPSDPDFQTSNTMPYFPKEKVERLSRTWMAGLEISSKLVG